MASPKLNFVQKQFQRILTEFKQIFKKMKQTFLHYERFKYIPSILKFCIIRQQNGQFYHGCVCLFYNWIFRLNKQPILSKRAEDLQLKKKEKCHFKTKSNLCVVIYSIFEIRYKKVYFSARKSISKMKLFTRTQFSHKLKMGQFFFYKITRYFTL